jgi:hypothetical protein
MDAPRPQTSRQTARPRTVVPTARAAKGKMVPHSPSGEILMATPATVDSKAMEQTDHDSFVEF